MKIIEHFSHLIDFQFRKFSKSELERAGFLIFHDQKILLDGQMPKPLEHHHLPSNLDLDDLIYVGSIDSRPYYSLALESDNHDLQAVSLRSLLDEEQGFFQLAGRAQQLMQWNQTHQFCGRCGTKTELAADELVRCCPSCDLRAYPRLSPCVIMLVHRGDQILLAQRPGANSTWYTVQAGFIEPGESAEEAVSREIWEEAGLKLSSLRYFGSQPWPFPGQLMLGYIAESTEGDLLPDPEELQNATWFDYRELPEVPGPNTISGKLIRHFVAERSAT